MKSNERKNEQQELSMKQQDKATLGRRDFLRVLATGAGAAAASAGPLATQAAADTENNDEKRKARYKGNSEDIKAYYRVNRYPS